MGIISPTYSVVGGYYLLGSRRLQESSENCGIRETNVHPTLAALQQLDFRWFNFGPSLASVCLHCPLSDMLKHHICSDKMGWDVRKE